jgi:DNA modification methylase
MGDVDFEELPQPEFEGTVPPAELETDGDNPNEMTDEQFGLLCDRMRQNGWLGGPIVTNTDGLIADGEHRWRAAQEIGLSEVPVRQFDIDDAERRLWRQELNKIHGEHDAKRDALEYDYLLDAGKSDEVHELVDAADEDLDELLAEIKMDTSKPAEYEYDPEHNVYFEDCVEGMRERLDDDSVDLFITDPPYSIDGEGIGVVGGDGKVGVSNAAELTEYDDFEGNEGDFDFREAWSLMKDKGEDFIIFGGNYFTDILPPTNAWIVWDKRAGSGSWFSDCEFAWTNLGISATIYDYEWQGMLREGSEQRYHPTQKPVELIGQFIKDHTDPGDLICDPFMGSGTTAVAAIQNDREYVGFEVDADNYRDVIERRIGEAKRQRDATVNEAEADD